MVGVVGELGVVLDVGDADFGVVAVEDAGDFLESGTPVGETVLVKCSCGMGRESDDEGWTYLVST